MHESNFNEVAHRYIFMYIPVKVSGIPLCNTFKNFLPYFRKIYDSFLLGDVCFWSAFLFFNFRGRGDGWILHIIKCTCMYYTICTKFAEKKSRIRQTYRHCSCLKVQVQFNLFVRHTGFRMRDNIYVCLFVSSPAREYFSHMKTLNVSLYFIRSWLAPPCFLLTVVLKPFYS